MRFLEVPMYDSYGDGWNDNGALRINVNGVNITTVSLNNGSIGSNSFFVDAGDIVNIYWTGYSGDWHEENAFIVYYAETPPSPMFNPTSWNGSNALLFRVQDTLSNADLNQLLGSFMVPAAGNRSIMLVQRSMNVLPSKALLPDTYSSRH